MFTNSEKSIDHGVEGWWGCCHRSVSSPPESIMDIRDNDVNSHNLLLHLNSRLETFPLLNWWLLENGEIRGVEGVEEVLLKT